MDAMTNETLGNSILYHRTKLKSGHIITVPVSDESDNTVEETDEPFDNETAICELLSVAEYNSCMLEMMNM